MMNHQLTLHFSCSFAVLVALVGCSGQPYKIAAATGTVMLQGRPAPGVEVQFCPDPEAMSKGPSSLGETDEQGKFVLRYAVPGEAESKVGAVVGTHKVMLADLRQKAAPQGHPPNPSRVPIMYGSLQTTPLRLEVKEGAGPLVIEVK
jgi:hypothetical protein